ncbi:polysaccharide biosynthesis protein [Aureitalea marina]|uniref:Polysaccharide biosynthesis protein CapD-like domain-containing protein n=1 Tax=Aureitalea marina TaxID=930804 RepID=A0A2S7KNQ7_9FLAO|nr:polysaccharide biosynthesis protein [Aureitalea marina]PQB04251.1 hypothetical protein BST85_04535 [Aureitalea marina]
MQDHHFRDRLDQLHTIYKQGLGADYLCPQEDDLSEAIVNTNILVSGAGSIGSFLVRCLIGLKPKRLVVFDNDPKQLDALQESFATKPGLPIEFVNLDLNDGTGVERLLARKDFKYVFHTAALKHLPPLEEDVVAAVRTNTLGSIHLFQACERHGVERCVYVSTDKAVSPISVLGRTKLVAENWIRSNASKLGDTKIVIARFGNVYGSAGSLVPYVENQLDEGGMINLTHPSADRFFISPVESIQLILSCFKQGEPGRTYICDMGDPIPVIRVIQHLAEAMNLSLDNRITTIGLRKGEKVSEQIAEKGSLLRPVDNASMYSVDYQNWSPLTDQNLYEIERLANLGNDTELNQFITALTS